MLFNDTSAQFRPFSILEHLDYIKTAPHTTKILSSQCEVSLMLTVWSCITIDPTKLNIRDVDIHPQKSSK